MSRAGRICGPIGLAGALIVLAPSAEPLWPAPSFALAQEDAAGSDPPANTPPASPQESPAVPHGSFLFDYLLVVLLIGGAIYAVCRPSRRI